MAACITSPPVQEMSDARQAISAAREARADTRAASELLQAEQLLEQAEQDIRQKQYGSARHNALSSHAKAKKARKLAEKNLTEPR